MGSAMSGSAAKSNFEPFGMDILATAPQALKKEHYSYDADDAVFLCAVTKFIATQQRPN